MGEDVKTATDEQCLKADEASLLQVAQEVVRSPLGTSNGHMSVQSADHNRSKCLRFMHIPKNAGSSIDSANMHLSPKRAFDSLSHRLYTKICDAIPTCKTNLQQKPGYLGALFDKTHSNVNFLHEIEHQY